MTYINLQGYLERNTKSKTNPHATASKRDWWLVKQCSGVTLNSVSFTKEYWEKRVRFKVEIYEGK